MLRARGLLLRRLAPLAGQATPSATRLAVRHASAGPVGYGSGPYRGLKPPKVAQWHKNVSVVYGTMLWLWLFYRCKTDGPALIGLEHPWDHGHHGHDDDHGHEHGEEGAEEEH